jgi:hypothetical protein
MAGSNEPWIGTGNLREVRTVDPDTGTRMKTFFGEPKAWMRQFQMRPYRARFDMEAIKKSMRNS